MESRFYDYGSAHSREHDVHYERKQELFLLAGTILLSTDHEKTCITNEDDSLPYIDTNGKSALRHVLTMNAVLDDKWGPLQDVGVMAATLTYQPERHLKGGPRLFDQVDLEVQTFDRPLDRYTMKLASLATSRSGAYVIRITNDGEIEERGYPLMEISVQDSVRISRVLKKVNGILNPETPGLATPYDI